MNRRRMMNNHPVSFRVFAGLLLVVVVTLTLALLAAGNHGAVSHASSGIVLTDYQHQNTSALPGALRRISWGAVIAGAVLALAIQSALNLLGISIGAMILNPETGDDLSAEAKSVSMGAVVWLVISTLIALFIGGWAAARFSGNPDHTDAWLTGLMVWGVSLIVSMVLLTTAIGRFVSGVSSLIGQGMELAGRAASATAQGVAGVATGMATATAGAAGGVAGAARSAVQAAQDSDSPEVSAAMQRLDQVFDSMKNDARQMFERAGVSAGNVQNRAEGAAQQVQSTMQNVARDPQQSIQQMNDIFQRIRNSGGNLTDSDRQQIIQMMVMQGNMSEEQARRQLQTWENNYNQARQQVDQVREQVQRKADQVRSQATQRVEQVKDQAQETAREAAQATTKAIARLAGAAFLALVLGAVAAGIGGRIGAPDSAKVSTNTVAPVGEFHYFQK